MAKYKVTWILPESKDDVEKIYEADHMQLAPTGAAVFIDIQQVAQIHLVPSDTQTDQGQPGEVVGIAVAYNSIEKL